MDTRREYEMKNMIALTLGGICTGAVVGTVLALSSQHGTQTPTTQVVRDAGAQIVTVTATPTPAPAAQQQPAVQHAVEITPPADTTTTVMVAPAVDPTTPTTAPTEETTAVTTPEATQPDTMDLGSGVTDEEGIRRAPAPPVTSRSPELGNQKENAPVPATTETPSEHPAH